MKSKNKSASCSGSNNIEGKITECWLVNEKGIFFSLNFACEEGQITGSRLVLSFPATAYAIKKLLQKKSPITMASRFEIVNEKYIQELKEKSRNENTKKSTG